MSLYVPQAAVLGAAMKMTDHVVQTLKTRTGRFLDQAASLALVFLQDSKINPLGGS
jgi:hypothetical protein